MAHSLVYAAHKPTSQSVTSSTTLVNETALAVPVLDGDIVVITWTLDCAWLASSTSGGIKLAISVPTNAAILSLSAYGSDLGTGSAAADAQHATTGSFNVMAAAGGTAGGVVEVVASVHVGDTSGNVTLRFAQSASNATATTIVAGSGVTAIWQTTPTRVAIVPNSGFINANTNATQLTFKQTPGDGLVVFVGYYDSGTVASPTAPFLGILDTVGNTYELIGSVAINGSDPGAIFIYAYQASKVIGAASNANTIQASWGGVGPISGDVVVMGVTRQNTTNMVDQATIQTASGTTGTALTTPGAPTNAPNELGCAYVFVGSLGRTAVPTTSAWTDETAPFGMVNGDDMATMPLMAFNTTIQGQMTQVANTTWAMIAFGIQGVGIAIDDALPSMKRRLIKKVLPTANGIYNSEVLPPVVTSFVTDDAPIPQKRLLRRLPPPKIIPQGDVVQARQTPEEYTTFLKKALRTPLSYLRIPAHDSVSSKIFEDPQIRQKNSLTRKTTLSTLRGGDEIPNTLWEESNLPQKKGIVSHPLALKFGGTDELPNTLWEVGVAQQKRPIRLTSLRQTVPSVDDLPSALKSEDTAVQQKKSLQSLSSPRRLVGADEVPSTLWEEEAVRWRAAAAPISARMSANVEEIPPSIVIDEALVLLKERLAPLRSVTVPLYEEYARVASVEDPVVVHETFNKVVRYPYSLQYQDEAVQNPLVDDYGALVTKRAKTVLSPLAPLYGEEVPSTPVVSAVDDYGVPRWVFIRQGLLYQSVPFEEVVPVIVPPKRKAHKPVLTSASFTLDRKTAEYVPTDYTTLEFDPERYAYLDDWGQPRYNVGPVTFLDFEEKVVREQRKEQGIRRFREEVKRVIWRTEQERRRQIIVVTSAGVAYLVIKWLIIP